MCVYERSKSVYAFQAVIHAHILITFCQHGLGGIPEPSEQSFSQTVPLKVHCSALCLAYLGTESAHV